MVKLGQSFRNSSLVPVCVDGGWEGPRPKAGDQGRAGVSEARRPGSPQEL